MPFKKGDPKPPGSGRKQGTPNKINAEVAERLAELKCDPVQGLAKIASNPRNDERLRARCYAELLEYCKPKLSRTEHVGAGGTPLFAVDAIREYMAGRPGLVKAG